MNTSLPYSANRTINTACIARISEHRTYAEAVQACYDYHVAHPEQVCTEIYGPGIHEIGGRSSWLAMLTFLDAHPEFKEATP